MHFKKPPLLLWENLTKPNSKNQAVKNSELQFSLANKTIELVHFESLAKTNRDSIEGLKRDIDVSKGNLEQLNSYVVAICLVVVVLEEDLFVCFRVAEEFFLIYASRLTKIYL